MDGFLVSDVLRGGAAKPTVGRPFGAEGNGWAIISLLDRWRWSRGLQQPVYVKSSSMAHGVDR